MSVSSPCEICQSRDVQHTCDRCAQLVCGKHFDTSVGFCIECAAELSGEGPPHREPGPDGVDTYRF